jgi:hypothetical protein
VKEGHGQVRLCAKTWTKGRGGLLSQIFTEREERKATAVASDAPLREWDKTVTGPRFCAAITNRLTFLTTPIQAGTGSTG